MSTILHELRRAFRSLRTAPGLAAAVVVTLGLAIGAAGAAFSLAGAILLRPLPYAEPEELVTIWNAAREERFAASPADFADLLERQSALAGLAAFTNRGLTVAGSEEPARADGLLVSPNLLDVLGVVPALGRSFHPEEGGAGSAPVALLDHGFWRRAFGGDPAIVGTEVRIDGAPVTVVGILPPAFGFPGTLSFSMPAHAEVWLPRRFEQSRDEPRGNQYLRLLGRRASGVTAERLAGDLQQVFTSFRRQDPERYAGGEWTGLAAVPLRDQVLGRAGGALAAASAAAALVLLAACANVASLLLARAAKRRGELSTCAALGATPGRLLRAALAETLLLGAAGGALGVPLAALLLRVIQRLAPAGVPRLAEVRLDGYFLGWALAATTIAALGANLLPALAAARSDPRDGLREREAGTLGSRRGRATQRVLVAVQTALGVIVIAGAGLLGTSYRRLLEVDPGFRAAGVTATQVHLPAGAAGASAAGRYAERGEMRRFYLDLLERLAAEPGIESAAIVDPLPLSGEAWGGSYTVEGEPADGQPQPHAEISRVSAGAFRALGIPLLRGRDFSAADRLDSTPVVIVDRSLADRHWPGQDPIGRRINRGPANEPQWLEVVGVVAPVRRDTLERAGEPQIYLPFEQRPYGSMWVVAKSARPESVAASLRRSLAAIDASLPAGRSLALEELVARASARERFSAALFAAFAALVLALAAVGIHGLVAYGAARSRRDLCVRAALGANTRQLRVHVLRFGLAPALLGLLAGLPLALAGARLLAEPAHLTPRATIGTVLAAAALLGLVALLGSWLPARRSARLELASTLRGE